MLKSAPAGLKGDRGPGAVPVKRVRCGSAQGLGAKRWQGKGLLGGGLAPCQRLQEVRPVHLRQLPLPPVFNSDEQGRQLDNFDTISCT